MYHQKDEMLAKDGFKKFMKYESCGYDSCRYSNSSNHIHCIRPGEWPHGGATVTQDALGS